MCGCGQLGWLNASGDDMSRFKKWEGKGTYMFSLIEFAPTDRDLGKDEI